MIPAVPAVGSHADYDYGTCVLSRVQQAELILSVVPPVPYNQGKATSQSLCCSGVLRSSLSEWLQESKKQTIFANFFFFLLIEDSTKEESKSDVNTDFGFV